MQDALMDKKREMIHELVSTVHTGLEDLNYEVEAGIITPKEAHSRALNLVASLRYGFDNQNFFWVQDQTPTLLYHPYEEFSGQNASLITEPVEEGRSVFAEIKTLVNETQEGYLDYLWESPDDAEAVVPVIAYAKEFTPWGWTIGTHISFEDIFYEIDRITQRLSLTTLIILSIIIVVLSYNIWTGLLSEIKKIHAEERLHISEERFRSLVENVPVGIYRNNIDPLGPLFMVNPFLLNLLGIPHKQAIKTKLADLFEKKSDRNKFVHHIEKYGIIQDLEVKLVRKDGPNIWANINVKRVEEKDGTIYFDGMVEDITTRKKAAMALKRSFEALKKLDKEKDEFIAIASHEMRTPMGVINGYASLLLGKKSEGMNPLQSNLVGKIQKNVKRLLKLVNDMLDIQKLEARHGDKAVITDEKIVPIIKSVMDDLKVKSDEKHIRLSFTSPKRFNPLVRINEDKLRQVLINLLGNAIKFTPEKGTIKVKAETQKKNKDFVQISVTDSGIGIPKEELKPIFEKFHQAQSHLEHTEEGTGLGLPICKRIIEKNFGGQIWAESDNGEGSTFSFTVKKVGTHPAQKER